MTPEMKKLLLDTRRTARTGATMMDNSRIGFLIICNSVKDQNQKAVLEAYLNMLPETVDELRSVANAVDKYVRAGAITDDEFVDLRWRASRIFKQSSAMSNEALSVLKPA